MGNDGSPIEIGKGRIEPNMIGSRDATAEQNALWMHADPSSVNPFRVGTGIVTSVQQGHRVGRFAAP